MAQEWTGPVPGSRIEPRVKGGLDDQEEIADEPARGTGAEPVDPATGGLLLSGETIVPAPSGDLAPGETPPPPDDIEVPPAPAEAPGPSPRLYQLRPPGLRPRRHFRPRTGSGLRNDCPPDGRKHSKPGQPPSRLR